MDKKIYNERLLRFADRLNQIEMMEPLIREVHIEWPEDHVKTWYDVTYNKKYFWELPKIFDEWTYIEGYGEIGLKQLPKLEVAGSCFKFFNLHPREFTHLFDVEGGFQNIEKYGGKPLNNYSLPSDVAYNIIEFVKKNQ